MENTRREIIIVDPQRVNNKVEKWNLAREDIEGFMKAHAFVTRACMTADWDEETKRETLSDILGVRVNNVLEAPKILAAQRAIVESLLKAS